MPFFASFWPNLTAESKDYQIQNPAVKGNDLFTAQNTKNHIEFPALGIATKIEKPCIPSQHYFFYNLSTQTLYTCYYPFNSVPCAPPQSAI